MGCYVDFFFVFLEGKDEDLLEVYRIASVISILLIYFTKGNRGL